MDIYGMDGYKYSHYLMDTEGLEYKSFYIEARTEEMPVLVHGFQRLINNIFNDLIVDEGGQEFFKKYGAPLNIEGLMLLEDYGWESLPLHIQVLREGTVTMAGIPLLQITNTDPRFAWLPGMFEDYLLNGWAACSVASQSWIAKQYIKHAMGVTCDDFDKLPIMLNDFGMRACQSQDTAAILGVGHLINFAGSDNTAAIRQVQRDYDTEEVYGCTIPASEHSVMTLSGREGELHFVRGLLRKFIDDVIPGPLMALVIDSYDDENFVKEVLFGSCKDLLEEIREAGKCLILRPDSGDPTVKVIQVLEWIKECIPDEIVINTKGYKTLPPYLGTIQGDGISILTGGRTLKQILLNLKSAGWATDATCFGSGGALLNGCNRDTFGFAYKLSAVKYAGDEEWTGVGKETPGKVSKKGRLAVVLNEKGLHECIQEEDLGDRENQLVTLYKDGFIGEEFQNFYQVIARSNEMDIYKLFEIKGGDSE